MYIRDDDMKDNDMQALACAVRGRGEGGDIRQTLETGGAEAANAVTTARKDSMVMEVGNIYPHDNPQAGRVYDDRGLSPTLSTMQGGNRQPKVISEREGREFALSEVRRLTSGKRDGRPVSVTMTERGDIRPLVETPTGQWRVLQENITANEANEANSVISRSRASIFGRSTGYRIRRLTPRECFRLMDVDEGNIDTIKAAGVSETQQYKMAGNSIVVACLYHIFRKLLIETGCEDEQPSLF